MKVQNIKVIDLSPYAKDICVLGEAEPDGAEMHLNYDYQLVDFGQPMFRDGEWDYEDDWRSMPVCLGCGAIQYEDGGWVRQDER